MKGRQQSVKQDIEDSLRGRREGQVLHAAQCMDPNGMMVFNNERRDEVSDYAFQETQKVQDQSSKWCVQCVASVIISEYIRKELVNGACAEAMQAESDSKDTN